MARVLRYSSRKPKKAGEFYVVVAPGGNLEPPDELKQIMQDEQETVNCHNDDPVAATVALKWFGAQYDMEAL